MAGAQRRLAAAVDELRAAGGPAEQQQAGKKLLRELLAVQRLFRPEPLATGGDAKGKKGRKTAGLFALLHQVLFVYSGGHTGATSTGAGGAAANLSMSLSSAAPTTSESVLQLLVDLLVRAFDYSAVPTINDALAAKTTSLYVKATFASVVSRLPTQDALQFIPEVVALASKAIRSADYYIKQVLLESVVNALANDAPRVAALHGEALKIVVKVYQDKAPEVRIAAAKLLSVIAAKSTASSGVASGGGNSLAFGGAGGAGNSGSATGSGNGGSSAGAPSSSVSNSGGPSSGSSGNGAGSGAGSATLEAILQVAAKGMDDNSVSARCEFAAVVGLVLAKFATLSVGESELQSNGDSSGSGPPSSGKSHGDEDDIRTSDPDNGFSSRTKLPFKLKNMHVPGMAGINLTRRKASAFNFSTIISVLLYFKDMVVTKHVSSNPAHNNGGILSSFAIALCSMFQHLPPDSVADNQIQEVLDAVLAILDHPFSLGDLARARNAVSYILRNGLFQALAERQQDLLLGVYLQRLREDGANPEANHHKTLSILVEVSHSYHAMGEAATGHSRESSVVLQGLLAHEKQSVRFQAAVAIAALVTALPYHFQAALQSCLNEVEQTTTLLLQADRKPPAEPIESEAVEDSLASSLGEDGAQRADAQSKIHLYALQGRTTAIAHMLRALTVGNQHKGGGLSLAMLNRIFKAAQELVESQFMDSCADSVWLTCTRAGWTLVSSLTTFQDAQWVCTNFQVLLNLWLKASVLHNRESSLELLRIEAAVMALGAFLSNYVSGKTQQNGDPLIKESIDVLANHVLHVYLTAVVGEPLSNPRKRRGQVARFRVIAWLLKCFALLPPIYCDSYVLLLDLIAEHTTAQALTSLRQSSLGKPADSTLLQLVLSPVDDVLELVSAARLLPGDSPSSLYSREINLALALQQPENALTDTEVEVQYMDHFLLMASSSSDTRLSLDGVCSSATPTRVVDACVHLFGRMFHFLPEDLQLRSLQHYAGILVDDRSVDCQVNVCSLLFAVVREVKLSAMNSSDSSPVSASSWPMQVQTMLCEMIASDNGKVRRGAGEALGLLAAALPDENRRALVIDIEKRLVSDKLPPGSGSGAVASSSPPSSNEHSLDPNVLFAGAAFALASIKRACGSRIAVDSALIFRFAGEVAQPLRTWVLHAWSLIMESVTTTVGDYEPFIQSTFALMEAQLLAGFVYSRKDNKKGLRWQSSAKTAIGRIINAMVASVGPELGAGSSSSDRLSELFSIWQLLRCRLDGDNYSFSYGGEDDGDSHVELQYVQFLEQVAVLAPVKFRRADFSYILSVVSDLAPAITPSSAWLPSSSSTSSVYALNTATGLSRSLLQRVALSCLRTIVERDPSLVRRCNLHCLLFAALHVSLNEMTWRYLPRLHGLWEPLTFTEAISALMTQRARVEAADELRASILALLELDSGRRNTNAQPCVWALLCRSIAIGESSNNFSGVADADNELMMSPKGLDAVLGLGGDRDDDDDLDSNAELSTAIGSKPSGTRDASQLASAAVAAQVEAWRSTKKVVSDLVGLLPPLSRHVRYFAVECVLQVFALVNESASNGGGAAASDYASHFDLVKTRGYFQSRLSSESTSDQVPNFLCMYLDEFVTLACHVSTSSADTSELQIFQSSGLRLIDLLLTKFGDARDPEVSSGEAMLLDPYQAQLSAALRHALKQTHAESEADASEIREFYAPLLVEAHAVCANAISARLVQDKVALNRILKTVLVRDYGHSHFVGDDVTRTRLVLANLSSVAQLLVSAIDADGPATEQKTAGARKSRVSGPLTTTMIKALSGQIDYLVQCWTDVTAGYSFVMQGAPSWPSSAHKPSEERKLQTLGVSVPAPILNQLEEGAGNALEAYRECYRHFWPAILTVLVYLQIYLPDLHGDNGKKDNARPSASPRGPSALTALALLHVASLTTGSRDRNENEISAVLSVLPLLFSALFKSRDSTAACEPAVTGKHILNSLINASLRSLSLNVRIQALRALFGCLSQQDIIRTAIEANEDILPLVTGAALAPLEVVHQLAANVLHRTEESVIEALRLSTNSIVFLHTSSDLRIRRAVVDAVTMVERCLEPISFLIADLPGASDMIVATSRASVEAALALSRAVDNSDDAELRECLSCRWKASFRFLTHWLSAVKQVGSQSDQLAFALRIIVNYTARYPSIVASETVAAFHADVASSVIDVVANRSDEAEGEIAAVMLGLAAIIKKLSDAQEHSSARRYLSLLAPHLLPILQESVSSDTLNATEQLLVALSEQLDEDSGAAFVGLLLPRLCRLLQYQPSPVLSAVVGRLLLAFAQGRAAAFKQAVGAMVPTERVILETTLRGAIAGTPASTSMVQRATGGSSTKPLDLSRYG